MSTDAVRDALARGELSDFDRAVEALGGARPLLRAWIAELPRERVDAIERLLPARPSGVGPWAPRLAVGALAALGPEALWVASEWILDVVPAREREAPSPAHEQWDALVEVHRARPEAAWLPIELLASLGADQYRLGRRIVLGLERRFGDRVQRIARARLRLGTPPLASVLEELAGGSR